MAEFNKKWLVGLKFRGSKSKTTNKDGRKLRVYEPYERDMTEADVLDWKVYGKDVVLVTADGQKVTVKK